MQLMTVRETLTEIWITEERDFADQGPLTDMDLEEDA
jgi:hypothetical protein